MRKVANANKPIKTNGFLMISWFARFKNRFGKLQKNMKKRCRKSDEFHEKPMRNLDVFGIEILRKIGSVRKVPNANKHIKTNGCLMIS